MCPGMKDQEEGARTTRCIKSCSDHIRSFLLNCCKSDIFVFKMVLSKMGIHK
ncbi:UNVERIFIED_CONTAM: hypothetical protein FKN15_053022 [Acipenser sinensis]